MPRIWHIRRKENVCIRRAKQAVGQANLHILAQKVSEWVSERDKEEVEKREGEIVKKSTQKCWKELRVKEVRTLNESAFPLRMVFRCVFVCDSLIHTEFKFLKMLHVITSHKFVWLKVWYLLFVYTLFSLLSSFGRLFVCLFVWSVVEPQQNAKQKLKCIGSFECSKSSKLI